MHLKITDIVPSLSKIPWHFLTNSCRLLLIVRFSSNTHKYHVDVGVLAFKVSIFVENM